MSSEKLVEKDRTCLKCGEVKTTTAKGIKAHAAKCKGINNDESKS